ncbi:hypothetical protein HPP92_028897 [Vanilla planifolia]|uniref:Tr-type G domain-containing protein n=1 Tax=Vanilla planifolia TaxID=51239 RepID=A0A835P5N1_VANPL|nr:hypothetical protein HPP92_028897 [Vanilla planifolia]KAG0446328.1 hypothetical protein HPP92_028887 [Vanilla planifolia]
MCSRHVTPISTSPIEGGMRVRNSGSFRGMEQSLSRSRVKPTEWNTVMRKASGVDVCWFRSQVVIKEKGSLLALVIWDESTDEQKYAVLLDTWPQRFWFQEDIWGIQADAAILVVDASVGFFLKLTREHAQFIRSFRVEQPIVAVNKMDLVGYKKERFDFHKDAAELS